MEIVKKIAMATVGCPSHHIDCYDQYINGERII